MFSLYPIRPRAAAEGWEWDDYEFSLVGIVAAPFVSLVALPFFAIKALKDSPILTERSARQQNAFDRDCRKVRFYARRLIPIIGYYWGHRLYEKQEKYQTLSTLSADQIEVLAFKRASDVPCAEQLLFCRERKLFRMVEQVSENNQIEAIFKGMRDFNMKVNPHFLQLFKYLSQKDPAKYSQAWGYLQEKEREELIKLGLSQPVN